MSAPHPYPVPPPAPHPQPETVQTLSTLPHPMLQSLGTLLGIPLRTDTVLQMSQFNAWCTAILERMGDIGRLAFTPSRENAAPATSTWGLSFCEVFLSHISQLPGRLMSLFSSVRHSSAQLDRYSQHLGNDAPMSQLQEILSGFSTAVSLYHLQETGQSLPVGKCRNSKVSPYAFPTSRYKALLKGVKGLLDHFKSIDPVAAKKLVDQIQHFLKNRALGAASFSGPIGPGGTAGPPVDDKSPLTPYDYHAWIVDCSLPIYASTTERSTTFTRYLSAQVQEITTIVTMLTRMYTVFGQCLGELLQTYQTLWLEFSRASGVSDAKQEAEMSLIGDLTEDPDLVQALQSAGVKSDSLNAWVSVENQNQSLQELQQVYVDSVNAVKELWGTAGLRDQIDALKNDLCELPEFIAPKWVQNAWQAAVEVQDQLDKLDHMIEALDESVKEGG